MFKPKILLGLACAALVLSGTSNVANAQKGGGKRTQTAFDVRNISSNDDIWVVIYPSSQAFPNASSFGELRRQGGKRVRRGKTLRMRVRPGQYNIAVASNSDLSETFRDGRGLGNTNGGDVRNNQAIANGERFRVIVATPNTIAITPAFSVWDAMINNVVQIN